MYVYKDLTQNFLTQIFFFYLLKISFYTQAEKEIILSERNAATAQQLVQIRNETKAAIVALVKN
jgi:hypothetical protein